MTYPILFAQGLYRFDTLWNRLLETDNASDPQLDQMHYYRGVRSMLLEQGYTVFHTHVPWGASLETRAEGLRRNVREILQTTGVDKVNIIGHSVGGLDARHMLFNDRNKGKIHQHVASLTTIATPHLGTSFADWVLDHVGTLPDILDILGIKVSGICDLQPRLCMAYNERTDVKAFELICQATTRFQTYAGYQQYRAVAAPLKIPYRIVEEREGDNDGLVSVASAKWREEYFQGIIENADHLNQLGWWNLEQYLVGENANKLLARMHGFFADLAKQLP